MTTRDSVRPSLPEHSYNRRVLSSGGWEIPHRIARRKFQRTVDDVLTAPVRILDLSTRSLNVLTQLQIGSIAELLAYPKQRIILARNMGSKSLNEIESKVFAYLSEGIVAHKSSKLRVHGVREVMQRKVWFDQDFLRKTFDGTRSPQFEKRSTQFTEREKQVLTMVSEGLANKEIANRLRISESAAKASLQQLFAKTGVRTRSQLVRLTLEHFVFTL